MLCLFIYLSLWYVSGYIWSVYLFICPCGRCQRIYGLCISLSILLVCVRVCMLCLFIYVSLWYVSEYVGSVYLFICPCGMCQDM